MQSPPGRMPSIAYASRSAAADVDILTVPSQVTKQAKRIYTAPRGGLGPGRLRRDGRAAFLPWRFTEADIYLLSLK
jgi:hypothetical protein